MCVCVRFTDCPHVTAAGVAGLLAGLTNLKRIELRPGPDFAFSSDHLSTEALKTLAHNNAFSLEQVILPAGVSGGQLEALLKPLKELRHLTVSAPSEGGSRWLRVLPYSLKVLDITGEMLPHWEHVMSVTSVRSGSRGVRSARSICVPITDGATTRTWLQHTLQSDDSMILSY